MQWREDARVWGRNRVAMNHPIRVRYQLDTEGLFLTEMEISDVKLSSASKSIPVKIYGNLLMAKFWNPNLSKDS